VDEDEDFEQFLDDLAFFVYWSDAWRRGLLSKDGRSGGFWNSWKQAWISSLFFGTLKPHFG
jgi:hypothetical protein